MRSVSELRDPWRRDGPGVGAVADQSCAPPTRGRWRRDGFGVAAGSRQSSLRWDEPSGGGGSAALDGMPIARCRRPASSMKDPVSSIEHQLTRRATPRAAHRQSASGHGNTFRHPTDASLRRKIQLSAGMSPRAARARMSRSQKRTTWWRQRFVERPAWVSHV